eukprot:scaffold2797_cov69-Phaeocystis_antarctica.AAC.2
MDRETRGLDHAGGYTLVACLIQLALCRQQHVTLALCHAACGHRHAEDDRGPAHRGKEDRVGRVPAGALLEVADQRVPDHLAQALCDGIAAARADLD